MEKHDAVYKPSHYEKEGCTSMQEIVRQMFVGTEGALPLSVYPWWKDALKYLWRWPLKHDTWDKRVEDLRKAKRCIDMIIEELEANGYQDCEQNNHIDDFPRMTKIQLRAGGRR